jgi:hypothetical protein
MNVKRKRIKVAEWDTPKKKFNKKQRVLVKLIITALTIYIKIGRG